MMQGTNVLFGQIAVVFGIVIAGVWSATQWTAAALGYQLRLGSPWFDFFGTPVYHPWRLFEWWFVFDAYAPRVFDTGGAIAGGSGLLAVVAGAVTVGLIASNSVSQSSVGFTQRPVVSDPYVLVTPDWLDLAAVSGPLTQEMLQNASGGIVFISDLAQLGKLQQMNLIFALERLERHNLQLVAASTRQLANLVDAGWDPGLVNRLGEVWVALPQISGHADDVPEIATMLLAHLAERGEEG